MGAEDVNLSEFDFAFTFDPEGRLLREINKDELLRAAASSGEVPLSDRVLIPELGAPADELERDPDSSHAHLQIGVAYWDWGLVEEARRHLETARTLDGARNPYPFFYLGQIEEAEGRHSEAAGLYREALKREDPPNPGFTEALKRVTRAPPS